MKFVNLTNHIIHEATTNTIIYPSGKIARIKTLTHTHAQYAGIPIYKSNLGVIQGLPKPKKDTVYIVSSLALNTVPKNRKDVVAPGNVIRDNKGNPVSCIGFKIN